MVPATDEELKRNASDCGTIVVALRLADLTKALPQLPHLMLNVCTSEMLPALDSTCAALRSLALHGVGASNYVCNIGATLKKVRASAGNLRRLELKGSMLDEEGIDALRSFIGLEDLRLEVREFGRSLDAVWISLVASNQCERGCHLLRYTDA